MRSVRFAVLAVALVVGCGGSRSDQESKAQEPRSAASPKNPSEKSRKERIAERILVLDAALQKGERELAEMERTGAPPDKIQEQRKKNDAVRHTLEQERAHLRMMESQR